MPKITKVVSLKEKEKVAVYIDNKFCILVRERTWKVMKLKIGDEITCNDLIEKEKFFWKKAYGKQSWEKEKYRIARIKKWFEKYLEGVEVAEIGFGTNNTNEILSHPKEAGAPDLLIRDKKSKKEIIHLEVSGTKYMRGNDYWIRPDKLNYIRNNPNKDIWIVLHYEKPIEKIIWIKPKLNNINKKIEDIEIRGVIEKYVIFRDGDEEIKSSQEFIECIKRK